MGVHLADNTSNGDAPGLGEKDKSFAVDLVALFLSSRLLFESPVLWLNLVQQADTRQMVKLLNLL